MCKVIGAEFASSQVNDLVPLKNMVHLNQKVKSCVWFKSISVESLPLLPQGRILWYPLLKMYAGPCVDTASRTFESRLPGLSLVGLMWGVTKCRLAPSSQKGLIIGQHYHHHCIIQYPQSRAWFLSLICAVWGKYLSETRENHVLLREHGLKSSTAWWHRPGWCLGLLWQRHPILHRSQGNLPAPCQV